MSGAKIAVWNARSIERGHEKENVIGMSASFDGVCI